MPQRENVFFVANPITNTIQVVSMSRKSGGRHNFLVHNDFMSSTDKRFRPVAIHFGPDGCLYVVDWVQQDHLTQRSGQNHPDRDKERGRI